MREATMLARAPKPASIPDQARRLTRSLCSIGPNPTRSGPGLAVQARADRLDDEPLGLVEVALGLRQRGADPPGPPLLDRAVERHGGELRRDVGAELARGLGLLDHRADQVVGLGDLLDGRLAER